MDTKHGEVNLQKMGPVVGVLGAGGLLWFGATLLSGNPATQKAFMQSFLWAWYFWMCLTLGLFGLTLLHHAIRPQWSLPLLRIYEAGSGPLSMLVMGLMFIPIALRMQDVYAWVDPAHQDAVLRTKSWFLNPTMFYAVTVGCFLVWLGMSLYLRSSSVREDETRDPTESQKRTNFAAPGIVVFFLTATAALTAWIMSLDAHWYSTVFGALIIIGNTLLGVAFSVTIFLAYHKKLPYANVISKPLTRDHGNMMLATTMLWAYLTLSQFLIIWAANLQEEVGYYMARSANGWNYLGLVLIVGGFFATFLALCSPRTKHTPRILIQVSIAIVVWRLLDSFWVVMPSLAGRKEQFSFQWQDIVVFIGVGGIWLSAFAYQFARARIFPVHDPRIREELDAVRS
ncbi:MAG: hypothetical protein WAO58_01675 [Fimbriimonadaceae bacterium]